VFDFKAAQRAEARIPVRRNKIARLGMEFRAALTAPILIARTVFIVCLCGQFIGFLARSVRDGKGLIFCHRVFDEGHNCYKNGAR
jgi:hypothetical protein